MKIFGYVPNFFKNLPSKNDKVLITITDIKEVEIDTGKMEIRIKGKKPIEYKPQPLYKDSIYRITGGKNG